MRLGESALSDRGGILASFVSRDLAAAQDAIGANRVGYWTYVGRPSCDLSELDARAAVPFGEHLMLRREVSRVAGVQAIAARRRPTRSSTVEPPKLVEVELA